MAAREYVLDTPGANLVAVADFNGDRHMDVATIVNDGTPAVRLMLGSGDGTLVAMPTAAFLLQDRAGDIAVGDFNGDSHPDLAVATSGPSGSVTIALGKGDGTFSLAPTVAAGTYSVKVRAVDVDGDGRQDLVIANAGSANITVAKGQGDGTFAPGVTYAVGVEPRDVVAATLNADSFPDLVVANRRSANVSVLLNRGDGTFTDAVSVPVATAPSFLLAADFNRDGRQDVFVNDADHGTMWMLAGNGDGTFQSPRQAAAVGGSGIVAADFNGDGVLDVATANGLSGTPLLGIVQGVGDGTFALKQKYALGDNGGSIATADFNEDGHPDLVVPSSKTTVLDSMMTVFIGTGAGTFAAAPCIYAGVNQPEESWIGDLNHDGIADLVIVGSPNVVVRLGTGGGNFQPAAIYPAGIYPQSLAIADLNEDGNLDVVTNTAVLLGTGTGTLQPAVLFPGGTSAWGDVAVADFNSDGHLDVVLAGPTATALFLGNGDGTFRPPTAISYGSTIVLAADFNGDGHADLVVDSPPTYGSTVWMVLLGRGDGTFQYRSGLDLSPHFPRPVVADFNGDGIPDVLLCHQSYDGVNPSRVEILAGNGDGTFRPLWFQTMWTQPEAIAAADFNHDGHQDLAYEIDSGILYVAEGNGDGTFKAATPYPLGPPRKLTVGDYDGDGRVDIVSSAPWVLCLIKNVTP